MENTTKSETGDIEFERTHEEGNTISRSDQQEMTEGTSNVDRSGTIKKILIAVILVALITFVIVDSLTNQYVKQLVEDFLAWIENNPVAGVFAFIGVYFLATVLFIPGSVLTLGSGFVFANAFGLGLGVYLASVSVFFGASTGAITAFLLGRYLLREWVQKLTKKYVIFEAIDAALGDKGFRIMALLRLSPIIPFNALNYIAGVTSVPFLAYVWSMFAILPGTVLYVFLGASAGSLADSASSGGTSKIRIVTIVVGFVFGVIAVAATSYYAKKELRKITEREEMEKEDEVTE
mmetsp:Transcript_739/g.1098  ORF Transcript_739/g.1098 Transcript_739/m.1098 type:complete len:292 (-) Transcript_739:351-1226(-)|eukprot:CAMPEP_0195520944 /NCGR_PEP_ID=MMETSP0794_2-20130614/17664_1 /TAXON_ID=515487 /ORGANISM="Stephanopyxis turris, Strain CCMP 815" /LENGTH=291 /DNA_ID=CAMNT_0040650391 /DNA_START=222 /DNA_END=1097 /DNA_ORIENTATION=+